MYDSGWNIIKKIETIGSSLPDVENGLMRDPSPNGITLEKALCARPENSEEQLASVPVFGQHADRLAVENWVLQAEKQRLEQEQTVLAMELRAWREGHESLCQEMLRMSRELTLSRQRAQLLENTTAALTEERDFREQEASGMRNQIEENGKRIGALEAITLELNAERDLLRREVPELHKQQAVQAAELESSGTRVRQLLEERERADRRISELAGLLDSAGQKNRQLLESWSWRLTRPVRWIVEWLFPR